MDVDWEYVAYDAAVTVVLIAEIQAELTARYGGPDETPVDPTEFAPPHGLFVVGRLSREPVACGGLRRHGDGVVELKRMFVRPAYRRAGLARRLLHVLEAAAREIGYRQLVLETGLVQPEAIALYESAGYEPVPAFGYYADAPLSRAYAKSL